MVNNFLLGLTLNSHLFELQNFLKFNNQLLQSAVLQEIKKKIISPYVSGQISRLFFCFVDLVEENMKKIKRNFLEINFGGKNDSKLPYIPVLCLQG